ncbi:Ras family domain-containing protein [Salpingoeca rosetta]|uniref:Ras family domain-containing protein n=1 Tax=Salpingoeca rosetta (strain ATCC 50818 / BSB-021) TaxID=946362 RepID=F2UIH4_SALR5|nr:Ras family domain-containing protein [Salpingoeca rosetta]EGD76923.1 Ras family domain-containing protein [Salpingoeca rosetta]|eukprot:XP_004991294.1 Ras family domain-containing protein [Salpingoeca rosetta]
MQEEDLEHPVKVLIVGNGAVGKSSMIQRYCKGIFTREYKKTIGVDFLEKKLSVKGEELRLMIWDTAGQEEFDSLTKAYYRDAEACVVAFSTIDRDSFEAVESWIKKVEDEVGRIPMVLIQNKVDLIEEAAMTKEEAEALADRIKLKFYRTSVQENYNVDQVFQYLSELYVDELKKSEQLAEGTTGSQASGDGTAAPKKRTFATSEGVVKLQPKQRTGGRKNKQLCSLG